MAVPNVLEIQQAHMKKCLNNNKLMTRQISID